jgi:hypothetical protein
MASVCAIFFWLALADAGEAEAQGVEFGGDGLQAGQLLVGVALAVDQLAAHLRGGQPAIQAGGAEGGVGLHVILDDVLDVRQQAGQVVLDRLAAPGGGGVQAGQPGAALVQGLAQGVPPPAEEQVRPALSQPQGADGIGHVAAPGGPPREAIGGATNQVNHFGGKIHDNPSGRFPGGIVECSPGKAIP